MISPFNKTPISVGTRLAAMFLDHFFMCMVAAAFFLPTMISTFSNALQVSHEPADFDLMKGPSLYIGIFGFALYFCKDIINGRSIAKRVLKLQVVDNKTDEAATPMQCFIRDIFCVLWPLEVIAAMANTSRRIGDRVAGTKLVWYDPSMEQPKINAGKLLLPVLISYGFMLLIIQLIPSISNDKTEYSKTSYNQNESKALEQVISDSLGKNMVPDIRIYDTVRNENLKYISVIMRRKENYISDDDNYRQLHETTSRIIYLMFPKETFTGQIQYVYKGDRQFASRSITLGTYLRPKEKK